MLEGAADLDLSAPPEGRRRSRASSPPGASATISARHARSQSVLGSGDRSEPAGVRGSDRDHDRARGCGAVSRPRGRRGRRRHGRGSAGRCREPVSLLGLTPGAHHDLEQSGVVVRGDQRRPAALRRSARSPGPGPRPGSGSPSRIRSSQTRARLRARPRRTSYRIRWSDRFLRSGTRSTWRAAPTPPPRAPR